MLNMADEQIYCSSNKLDNVDSKLLKDIQTDSYDEFDYINNKMKVKVLKK